MSGWASKLLNREQFEELRNNPEELLRTVERIAGEKQLAEKKQWNEQAEDERHQFRQALDALKADRDALRQRGSSFSSLPPESFSFASSAGAEDATAAADLWARMEALETDYRSALSLSEIKASRISFLEGKVQSLREELLSVQSKQIQVDSDLASSQAESKRLRALNQELQLALESERTDKERLTQQYQLQNTQLRQAQTRQRTQEDELTLQIEQVQLDHQKLQLLHTHTQERLARALEQNTRHTHDLARLRETTEQQAGTIAQLKELNASLTCSQADRHQTFTALEKQRDKLAEQLHEARAHQQTLQRTLTEKDSELQQLHADSPAALLLRQRDASPDERAGQLQELIATYEKKSAELVAEKKQTQHLTAMLETIQKTIQQKVPVMEEMRAQYHRSQLEVQRLSELVRTEMAGRFQSQKQLDATEKECATLLSERDALARQVHLLLKENAEIAASYDSHSRPPSFQSIVKLHERNMELERLVLVSEKEVDLQHQCHEAQQELRHTQGQLKMAQSELAYFKSHNLSASVLLSGENVASRSGSPAKTSGSPVSYEQARETMAMKEKMADLQSTIAGLESSLQSMREQRDALETHSQDLRRQHHTLQEELATLRVAATQSEEAYQQHKQLVSQGNERVAQLESQLATLQGTVQTLQKKNQWQQDQLTALQSDKSTLQSCLEKLQQQARLTEDYHTRHEADLAEELTTCKEELRQTKQAKAKDFEGYRETLYFRDKKLEETTYEMERQKSLVRQHQSKEAAAQTALLHAQSQVDDLRQQVAASDARLNLLIKQGVGAFTSSSAVSQSSDDQWEGAMSQIKSLEERLVHAQDEKEEYKSMLELSESAAQDMASKSEQQIQEAIRAAEAWKAKFLDASRQLDSSATRTQSLQAQMEKMDQLQQEYDQLLSKLKFELEALGLQRDEYESNWRTTEIKYEQEMHAHAEDAQRHELLRQELAQCKQDASALQSQYSELQSRFQQLESTTEQKINTMNERHQEAHQRNRELAQQNDLLLNQLTALQGESAPVDPEHVHAQLQETVKSLQKQRLTWQTEKSELLTRVEALHQQEERLAAERDQWKGQAQAAKTTAPETSSMANQISALLQSNDLLRRKHDATLQKLTAAQTEHQASLAQLQELERLRTRVQILTQENENLHKSSRVWSDLVEQFKAQQGAHISQEDWNALEQARAQAEKEAKQYKLLLQKARRAQQTREPEQMVVDSTPADTTPVPPQAEELDATLEIRTPRRPEEDDGPVWTEDPPADAAGSSTPMQNEEGHSSDEESDSDQEDLTMAEGESKSDDTPSATFVPVPVQPPPAPAPTPKKRSRESTEPASTEPSKKKAKRSNTPKLKKLRDVTRKKKPPTGGAGGK